MAGTATGADRARLVVVALAFANALPAFATRHPPFPFWPYLFAGAYHRARGGAVASWSFTELPHWSLRYAPGEAPPKRPAFSVFDPCVYRYEEDGAYYDVVLAYGTERPFDGDVPGPRFVRLASQGKWTLYGKAHPAFTPRDARRGVCASSHFAVGVRRFRGMGMGNTSASRGGRRPRLASRGVWFPAANLAKARGRTRGVAPFGTRLPLPSFTPLERTAP